jgi:transcriptional regulator with XRE-family HTH domain
MANISPVIKEEEGNRLRAAYQRMKMTKRITQAQISTECGWLNASTFNRLLSGKIALTIEPLMKLAKVLGVPPASISPRLIQQSSPGLENRIARQLPVNLVTSVSRSSWGEPFLTEQRLTYFTNDQSAFALTFEAGQAPAPLAGWIVVVEPGRKALTNDFVIVRHGVGKYSLGRVQATHEDGTTGIEIEGLGVVLTSPRRLMLVSNLCRLADLQTFRACADS